MIQFDYCNIFQMGWNHQLCRVSFQVLSYLPGKRRICKTVAGWDGQVGGNGAGQWMVPWRLQGRWAPDPVINGVMGFPLLAMAENLPWGLEPGFISPFIRGIPGIYLNHQPGPQPPNNHSGEGWRVRPRWYPFKTTENNPGLATKTPNKIS